MNNPVAVLTAALLAVSLAACQNKEESMPMPETGAIQEPVPETSPPTQMGAPPASSEGTAPESANQPGGAPPAQ